MPKQYTFPSLFDDALQIHISKLKNWGYLDVNKIKEGAIKWSRNGNKRGSISIKVNTMSQQPFVELDYKHNEEPYRYKVYLVSVPSNLEKGVIWCFLCPQTNKRCRNLYLINGRFLHREAFKISMYESQTQSKK